MTQKFTAEEVRKIATNLDDLVAPNLVLNRASAALRAYADTLSKPADSGWVSESMVCRMFEVMNAHFESEFQSLNKLSDEDEATAKRGIRAGLAALAAQGQMEEFARVAASAAACPACGSYGPCVDSVACGALAAQGQGDEERCMAFRAGARWADAHPSDPTSPRVLQISRESNAYAEQPYPWSLWKEPTAPPAPPAGVPDEATDEFVPRWWDESHGDAYKEGWNDCRAALLAAAPPQPESES